MEEEIKIGYSFMGVDSDRFEKAYPSEELAIDAALSEFYKGTIPSNVYIVEVYGFDTNKMIENAMRNCIEYMQEVYDEFESGIDDGEVIINPEIMNIVCPVIAQNVMLGGITQKGAIMYEYDLSKNKIVE